MNRIQTAGFSRSSRQHGVALVIALILLVVVTLVGLAAVKGTVMQQKMSANFYDREIAFQDTEAAMRQAALKIEANGATGAAGYHDCSPGSGNLCLSNPFVTCPTGTTCSVGTITTVPTTDYNAGNMAVVNPQYIIQYLGNFAVPIPNVKTIGCVGGYNGCQEAKQMADFYRITARSGDPSKLSGRAYVVLQSVFRK